MALHPTARLISRTRQLPDADQADRIAVAEFGMPSTMWSRGDDRMTGYGETMRLTFSGPDRVADAARAWREVVDAAVVDDEAGAPGRGLIAFGAFTFADMSKRQSVLVVPERIVGVRDGLAFETRITGRAVRRRVKTASAPAIAFSPARYVDAVESAVAAIRAGRLEKVVIARDKLVPVPDDLPATSFAETLRSTYPTAWVFAVDGFFGASPETLIAFDGHEATSRVLAGTTPRDTDVERDTKLRDDLMSSTKDLHEHALAAQSLVAAIDGLAERLTAHGPFALELPNVWHIATDVRAGVRAGVQVLDLVAALHPTAAVAGTPRREAQELIAETEPFDRGRYAGPVGWVGADGTGEWAVAVRSAELLKDGVVRAFAGAGIVAASDSWTELAETDWKLQPILGAVEQTISEAAEPRSVLDRLLAQ